MAKKVIRAAAALALATVTTTPAYAVDYTISLLSPTSGNSSAYLYTMGSGVNLLNLKVTAWSINSSGVVGAASIGAYSGGLGVTYPGESTGTPQHSIDNSGKIDFLLFQFDKQVDLNAFYVGWYSGDADATIGWGPGTNTWNATPTWNGTTDPTFNSFSKVNSLVSTPAESTGWRYPATGDAKADSWIISALTPANGTADYFKLEKLKVTYAPGGGNVPPVPEPATWLMMIAGFGGIGWSMRRRRSAAELDKGVAHA